MFPPNLQKSIRELDRQISLLENECDNMESEKSVSPNQKASSIRDFPSKPYVTGPSQSTISYPTRRLNAVPIIPKICSLGSVTTTILGNKTVNEQLVHSYIINNSNKNFLKMRASKNGDTHLMEGVAEKKTKSRSSGGERAEGELGKCELQKAETKSESSETISHNLEGKPVGVQGHKRSQSSNASISSIKLSETSDPGLDVRENNVEWVASEKYKVPVYSNKWSKRPFVDKKFDENPSKLKSKCKTDTVRKKSSKLISSGEESKKKNHKEKSAQNLGDNFSKNSERPYTSLEQFSRKKRRPRSCRTRKKSENEISLDVNITKAIQEKEIQCKLVNEDSEKEEFLTNLSGSIKTLHLLITELRKKSSEEKRNDVLKDMQNTLMKINGIKLQNSFKQLTSPKDGRCKFLDEEEKSVLDVKKTFFGVKKFCEQLSDEKAYLSDELALKNRTISNMKNKEKEYLSLISNLKVNLEKIREQSDDGERAKRELVSTRLKLDEEAKVIEALKRSHAKMQDLVKNYVLENDKLRTQLRITKMESQKYNVLLAGKEVEIKKYKEEIMSFQRQISEQLNLLRLKALSNPVENTVKALTNQSTFRNSSMGKNTEITSETNDNCSLSFDTSKTSLNSLWNQTQDCKTDEMVSFSTFIEVNTKERAEENQDSSKRAPRSSVNDCGYTSCRSNESEAEVTLDDNITVKSERSFQGNDVFKKVKTNSTQEMFQNTRKKSSGKQWKNSRIDYNSSQNTLMSTSSECVRI